MPDQMLTMITVLSLVLSRFPPASIYSNDPVVLSIAATILPFAGLFQPADLTRCITSYALRGYRIARISIFTHTATFWDYDLLSGYLLAYRSDTGTYGFWTALITPLTVAVVALV